MRKLLACGALLLGLASSPARAGIPVIDVANLTQAIQEVLSSITQITNQIEQIQLLTTQIDQFTTQINQLQQNLQSINGIRGLVDVAQSPMLRDYIPTDVLPVIQAITNGGYAGLGGAARASRDAGMIYNCLELVDIQQQRRCQAKMAAPYQQREFYNDALRRSSQRMSQIQQLRASAAGTADPKAIQEAQARIQLEMAMLQHELAQIELTNSQYRAEQEVAVSRSLEREQAQATKATRASQLPW